MIPGNMSRSLAELSSSPSLRTKLLRASTSNSETTDTSDGSLPLKPPVFTKSPICLPASLSKTPIPVKPGKSYVDLIGRYTDPYAPFKVVEKDPILPKVPPKSLHSSVTEPRYRTIDEKWEREHERAEGRKRFRELLELAGVSYESFIPDVPRQTPVSSTPIADRKGVATFDSANASPRTSNSIDSPILIEDSSSSFVDLSNFSSKDDDLDPSIKATILKGVTCYVEARIGKEDRSDAVQAELRKLGASIEKNFTRKVTHVVFKEGILSTYLKAKKWEIPLVSIRWIEACKAARKVVDAALYPSLNLEKYDLFPFETFKKRRRRHKFTTPNDLSKLVSDIKQISASTPTSSPKPALTKRKVLADIKNDPKNSPEGNRRANAAFEHKSIFSANETTFLSSDDSLLENISVDSSPSTPNDSNRRKSAPAEPHKSKKRKLKDILTEGRVKKQKQDASVAFSGLKLLITAQKNRRPLFDPKALVSFEDQNQIVTPVRSPSQVSTSKSKSLLKKALTNGARKALFPGDEAQLSDSFEIFELKKKPTTKTVTPTIVFTSLSKKELKTLEKKVNDLGIFSVEPNVTKNTTHVLSPVPVRRTINLLKGLVRGCWLLDVDWLLKSESAGKWKAEEPFELKSFSPVVTQCRLEKQAFGKDFRLDLFSKVGPIYIHPSDQPPTSDIIELLKLCKGTIASVLRAAAIVIGGIPANCSIPHVNVLWVLDSITHNTCLDLTDYIIK